MPDSANRNLSETAKELLSWMIAAYVLLGSDEDLRVIQTHPGGGMYDCLTIIDDGDGMPLMMNRAGQSAEIDNRSIQDFWAKSAKQGPMRMAGRIGKACSHERGAEHVPSLTALSVLNIANWLNSYQSLPRTAVSAYMDTSGGESSPNTEILSHFPVPQTWLDQEPPNPNSDPTAWLFALVEGEEPRVLVNTRTGAAISVSGAQWNGWPELAYQPDGDLGCPIAHRVTAFDPRNGGELVAKVICSPGSASRIRGRYQEEYFSPVTVEPVFEVPKGYFESINLALSRN